MTNTQRISGISIIRVIAMWSIVIGHICSWKGIYTYQLGAIGVEIFLFISGYLYGNREIENRKKWILNRGKRILIPFWIFAAFMVICLAIQGKWLDSFRQLFSAAFNFQGLNYLFFASNLQWNYIEGIGHCWFVTMIMLCYILTVLLKGSKTETLIDKNPIKSLLVAVVVQIVFAMLGVQLSYIFQYFLGYFYHRHEKQFEEKKQK